MKIKAKIVLLYLTIIAATIAVVMMSIYIFSYKKPLEYFSKTTETGFQIKQNDNWTDFYVKGINIGAALPGKWFTEFPEDEDVYLGWFEKIGEMNSNCIRVYTLLPSQFYNALAKYNKQNKDKPIWLLQEIWPDENPKDMDYLGEKYVDDYKMEIRYVIDAIHGNARIYERRGRAYGVYSSDISQYVLGYLVGRELEPDEIIATNEMNKGYSFNGEYFSTRSNTSPSEGWLAMNCDYVVSYEENQYSSQHPVSIVSWPTLDPKEHDSEWNEEGLKSMEYNDKVSININNINTEAKLKAGFFGSYHIYPNYPDFMNNEDKYNNYFDEDGRFRYGAYLQEFIEEHTKYPALVAEFGVPTGMGNAHTSSDGLNHGGLSEEQQGDGIVRMMKAIKKEGYAGGVIFEWIDEWAKKTWITEPYMIPYDRHVLWHNIIDPEQNYGILAMESIEPEEDEYVQNGNGVINSIGIKHDSSYLYITISFNEIPDFSSEQLMIGLDTYGRNKGDIKFMENSDIQSSTGSEFMIKIENDKSAKLLVQPEYNLVNNKYSSLNSDTGIYEEIHMEINNRQVTKDGQIIEPIYEDCSLLSYGIFEDNSYYEWYCDDNKIYFRIPWGRLNFSDPSSMTVIDDNSTTGELVRDQLHTTKSDGILISALLFNGEQNKKVDLLSTEDPFIWSEWNEVKYNERLKKSYYFVKDYFGSFEH